MAVRHLDQIASEQLPPETLYDETVIRIRGRSVNAEIFLWSFRENYCGDENELT